MSSAFQALSLDEAGSVNIEGAIVATEPPIIRPNTRLSKRIRRCPYMTDVTVKEMEGKILIFIRCDVLEACWVLESRLGNKTELLYRAK